MGLDLAEIFMDVEDAFSVRLDESWDGTVGDLVARVLAKLPEGGAGQVCHSSFVFYRIRAALALVDPARTRRIRPSTSLSEWPARRLVRSWRDLEIDAGLRLPDLSLRLPLPLAAVAGCVGVVLAITAGSVWGAGWAWLWLPLSLAIAWSLAPRSVPRHLATVGDLVRAVLPLNVARVQSLAGPPGGREVAEMVRQIVASRLDLPLEKVRPEAHLVRDLGAG